MGSELSRPSAMQPAGMAYGRVIHACNVPKCGTEPPPNGWAFITVRLERTRTAGCRDKS